MNEVVEEFYEEHASSNSQMSEMGFLAQHVFHGRRQHLE